AQLSGRAHAADQRHPRPGAHLAQSGSGQVDDPRAGDSVSTRRLPARAEPRPELRSAGAIAGSCPQPQVSVRSMPMIRGVHTMFYTSEPEALRAFLRDKLGFPATDVGGGWLIFDLPEADMGCHPADPGEGAPS